MLLQSHSMGLFDRFRKKDKQDNPPTPRSSSLPSISYGIAYFVLPHYAFQDCDKLVTMFIDTPATVGPFFYLMGCQMQELEPVHEDAGGFKPHHGELDRERDYFLLQYPVPPPVDFSGMDPTRVDPEELPVLAPHFSVVIRHRATKEVRYFVLGQAPIGGGTTLRCVTPDGMNANLGPGPGPELEEFLAHLRASR